MLLRTFLQRPAVAIGLAGLLAAGLLLLGMGLLGKAPPPGVTLHDLADIEDLRTRFNGDRGVPRLILVVSPT